MLTSTVYDVRIKYSVDGRGAAGVRGVSDEVRTLGRESGTASRMVGRLGAAIVASFGARAAGSALIGFNSTVQDTKLEIAGMLALTKKTDLSDQIGRADRLFGNLQRRAASLPGTTAEYTRMAGMLTQPITDAGLGLKDLEDLTVNSVVGAKALHVEWEAAARDVDQALRGQFHSTDVFTGKILGSVGYKGEEGRQKYNAMDPAARAQVLKDALMQKQLAQMAAAQGQTFSGVLSTLQDTVQQFFGKVGLPLFKAISAEIKSWNSWFDSHQDKVDAFAQRLAEGLVTGFRVVKDVLGFLLDHADTLFALAKVWAAVKIGGMLTGGVGLGAAAAGKGKALAGWASKARDEFDPETGAYKYTPAGAGQRALGLKGVVANVGTLAQTGLGAYELANMLGLDDVGAKFGEAVARMNPMVDEFARVTASTQALDEAMQRAAQAADEGHKNQSQLGAVVEDYKSQANAISAYIKALDDAKAADAAKGNGVLSLGHNADYFTAMSRAGDLKDILENKYGIDTSQTPEQLKYQQGLFNTRAGADQMRGDVAATSADIWIAALERSSLTEYQRQTLDQQKAANEVFGYINQHLAKGVPVNPAEIVDLLKNATDDPNGTHKPISSKPNVNITIQRIEVQSDDPDRYAFGLVEAFRDAVKNPSQAVRTIREG